jgi:hypothetical protein
MGVLLVSATDRTVDLTTSNGDRVWLEPMPVAVGRIPAWSVTPLAGFRAYARRRPGDKGGGPAKITAAEARRIAAGLIAFADQADRVAAGR